jgi:AcrR family transcriptional regulator
MEETAAVRARILEEAARLFTVRGYAGLSMREVAEAAGVSKAGIYYHFQDKENLFLAVLAASLERLEGLILSARQEGATAREQVRAVMRAILAQAPEQRNIIRLASQEMARLSQAARVSFGRLYHEKFIGRVEEVLREGIARGELRPVDARLAAWMLLGMAYPFLYQAHEKELGPPAAAVDLMVSVFFDGIAR